MNGLPPDGPTSPSRRNFLAAVGATVASINTAACIRKPRELILPFSKRPEDLVPGEPAYFATAYNVGETVFGLVVKSSDGRPTKVEGNPRHPLSEGASNAWAQATVLGLYAPERSRHPVWNGETLDGEAAKAQIAALAKELEASAGKGLALLIDHTPSPTLHRLIEELATTYPEAAVYAHDGAGDDNALEGARMLGLSNVVVRPHGAARVIAAFDADPLGTEGDVVGFTRAFTKNRDPSDPSG
ncbi:MAG: hypothetical protein HC923_01875 [Myxococcales bacterium]|nr:hypothetical protein [Myxococcales bacterium]